MMNMIQLICSDIDGTLLDKNRELSQETVAEVKRIKDNIPFVLISSRMPRSMRILQEELDVLTHPLVAYNGALVIDQEKVLNSIEMPHHLMLSINAYCQGAIVHTSLYHNDEWIVSAMDYWAKREENNTKVSPTVMEFEQIASKWEQEKKGCHKVMCMGEKEEIDVVYEKLVQNHRHELNIYRSRPTYIEISDINQDKASGLELLLEHKYPKLSMKNVMAFGDNLNDTTLIEKSGFGVAVANAKQEVLAVADYISEKSIDHGVALFMRKYF